MNDCVRHFSMHAHGSGFGCMSVNNYYIFYLNNVCVICMLLCALRLWISSKWNRPDTTVMVDWVQNTKLLTCLLIHVDFIPLFVVHAEHPRFPSKGTKKYFTCIQLLANKLQLTSTRLFMFVDVFYSVNRDCLTLVYRTKSTCLLHPLFLFIYLFILLFY